MAKKIFYLSFSLSRGVLRMCSTVLTMIFVLFCYVSGQVTRVTSQKEGKNPGAFTVMKGILTNTIADIAPDYGIEPLYGIIPDYGVAEYGMPYATYGLQGTVTSREDGAKLDGVAVSLVDTSSKEILDTDTTDQDGYFELQAENVLPMSNVWFVKVTGKNVAGIQYSDDDTLVSIPVDSLKNGDGWYAGEAEATVDIALEKALGVFDADFDKNQKARLQPIIRADKGYLSIQFPVNLSAELQLNLYNGSGKLVKRLYRGTMGSQNTINLNTRGLSRGTYFIQFAVPDEAYAAVSKVTVTR